MGSVPRNSLLLVFEVDTAEHYSGFHQGFSWLCRAMFDGHYKEKEASVIPVPNISFEVFESMMRAIYTGKCTRLTDT